MKTGSVRWLPAAGVALMMGVSGLAILIQGSKATAQNDNCYMVTSSGRVVSLNKLCGTGKLSPGSGVPGASGSPASNMFQAKIKYRLGKTPVIDVTFNNQQTFEMIVDTGADGTLITRNMAQAMQLPITGMGQFEMADGRVINLPMTQLRSISVNGAEVKNVEVAIAEKSNIGLLGHDFFDNYDVKIRQNVVEFYRR